METALRVEITTDGRATVVRPSGDRLDIEVAGELRAMLLGLIDQGQRRLVVDLEAITFVDSSGLGALVSALKTLKRTSGEGDVCLARVQPPVSSLLKVIRLDRVFSSYSTVEQAVDSIRAR